MLKVAIIGCGKIADAHAEQIRRIPGCELVAACDREPLMAEQLCDRFGVKQAFEDAGEMLRQCRPDVVHITTPPQGHYSLGKLCLENGCAAYIEKPFTVHAGEAEELIAIARKTGRKLTVGHDLQFSHAARRMRELVRSGYLGGPPVHLESYYCYDLGNSAYAKAILHDRRHWVRALPGKLLQNIISHGIARLAGFISDPAPRVIATGFPSPRLQSVGELEIVDELRAVMTTASGTTAYFTFSSQMKPALNHLRVYGPKNGLTLDEDHQAVIRFPGQRRKSYAEKFISPLGVSLQYLQNVGSNLRRFVGNDFHMKAGMHFLISSFYEAVQGKKAEPIPYREILLTARIMEDIFNSLSSRQPQGTGGESEASVLDSATRPTQLRTTAGSGELRS